jgi:outer membrane protein
MIRKSLVAAAAAGAALLAQPVLAAEAKIAVVRSADIFQKAPQYKAAEDKMKAEFDKRKTELEAQGKQLGEDIKKYQRDGDIMSASDRAKTEKDLNTRQVDFQYAQKKFQEDLSARDRDLTKSLTETIKTVIVQLAKEKGYDVILQDPVYAAPDVDITDEVLKRLNSTGAGK